MGSVLFVSLVLCVHMAVWRAEEIVCDLSDVLHLLSAGLRKGQRSGLIVWLEGEVMLTYIPIGYPCPSDKAELVIYHAHGVDTIIGTPVWQNT